MYVEVRRDLPEGLAHGEEAEEGALVEARHGEHGGLLPKLGLGRAVREVYMFTSTSTSINTFTAHRSTRNLDMHVVRVQHATR